MPVGNRRPTTSSTATSCTSPTPTTRRTRPWRRSVPAADWPALFNGRLAGHHETMAQIGAALGGVPKHVVVDPSMAPPMVMGPPLYGSPETVLG